MTDQPDTTHYITLRSDMIAGRRGEVMLDLICTAAPGADCRKRPADPTREEWSVDDPDLIDGDCWAVEWVTEGGWEAVATDHAELGRIPVAVEYDEGVLVSPVAPHPVLPIEPDPYGPLAFAPDADGAPSVTAPVADDPVDDAVDGEQGERRNLNAQATGAA